MLEHDGKKQTISQWARDLGVTRQCLYERLNAGWSVAKVLSTKKWETKKRKYHLEPGQKFGRLTFAKEFTIRQNGVNRRIAVVRCDCGAVVHKPLLEIVYGRIRSCGCLNKERKHDTGGN